MSCGAIDPGREKFGWAFADEAGKLLFSGISPSTSFSVWCQAIVAADIASFDQWRQEGAASNLKMPFFPLLLGNGTASPLFARELENAGIPFRLAEEYGSTLEARTLFWRLHPPRGWRRFFPLSLQVPPRPLDDLAAWVLILRESASEPRK